MEEKGAGSTTGPLLLPSPMHHEAAVNVDRLPRDLRRILRGQKGHQPGHIPGFARSFHRDVLHPFIH